MSELTTGEKGVIVKVLGHGGFRKRIVEMGFIKGKTVEVLLNAPLKDPIKYKVLGYEISLRRQEAEMIEVVSEEEAKKQAGETIYHEGLPEDVSVKEERNVGEVLKDVMPEDFIKFGLIPEFIGRVPVMVSLEQLTKEAMVRILSEPKNALTKQYKKLFELDDVKLEFTPEALEEVANLAVKRKIGARGLRSILENAMMDLMYEIPSDDTVGICTITKDVIDKTGGPELVYRDAAPTTARKSVADRLRGGKKGEIA